MRGRVANHFRRKSSVNRATTIKLIERSGLIDVIRKLGLENRDLTFQPGLSLARYFLKRSMNNA
jgi:hypothetical protein